MRIPQGTRGRDRARDASRQRSFNETRGTLDAVRARMRSVFALSLVLIATSAAAGPVGGGKGGGGGGPLGAVSAGIGSATRGGSPSPGGNGPPQGNLDYDRDRDYDGDPVNCYTRLMVPIPCPVGIGTAINPLKGDIVVLRRRHLQPRIATNSEAKLHVYAGAQKVTDSDGAGVVEIGVTDWRMRLDGTFTRYYERQQGGGVLTMTMPTLMGGFRIDDWGNTAVYLQGGVVHARTNGDQMGDSKITGPIAGMRVEHSLSKQISLLGDVHQMWFNYDIRATQGRVALRYKYLQAGFRVLDFNVGPPLYGPEVGVRF